MELTRDHRLTLSIASESDIGICRRKTVMIAKQIGFDDVKSGELAIVVTELVTNVMKHGGREGKFFINEITNGEGHKAIEVWCCDSGPGIPNIERALKDGFSNQVSLGIGLGSIRRFSDVFEINPSDADRIAEDELAELKAYNNRIQSLKWLPGKKWIGSNRSLLIGAASRSKPGEQLNGDCYVINHLSSTKTIAAVIDGLGHGKEAHLASQLAREQILLKAGLPVDQLLNHIHEGTKGTRGLVAAVVSINIETKRMSFSGIGNIAGFVYSSNKKNNLLSFGGIIGHNMRVPRIFEYEFKPGDVLCLFSDGINSRWDDEEINWTEHPQKNAELILTNYTKDNDDSTILIIRYEA